MLKSCICYFLTLSDKDPNSEDKLNPLEILEERLKKPLKDYISTRYKEVKISTSLAAWCNMVVENRSLSEIDIFGPRLNNSFIKLAKMFLKENAGYLGEVKLIEENWSNFIVLVILIISDLNSDKNRFLKNLYSSEDEIIFVSKTESDLNGDKVGDNFRSNSGKRGAVTSQLDYDILPMSIRSRTDVNGGNAEYQVDDIGLLIIMLKEYTSKYRSLKNLLNNMGATLKNKVISIILNFPKLSQEEQDLWDILTKPNLDLKINIQSNTVFSRSYESDGTYNYVSTPKDLFLSSLGIE